MSDSSDDEVSLRADSLAALQEFLKEQKQQEQQTEEIGEDWQLSQFWYSQSTSDHVAKTIAEETIPRDGKKRILCLSTPSIFKTIHANEEIASQLEYHLFEYDRRFGVYGDRFSYYDYNEPLEFGMEHLQQYDLICFDPPFLSEECIEKVQKTIEALSHSHTRLILLTGRIQWPHIQRLFKNMHICKFHPEHPRLSNDFFCCSVSVVCCWIDRSREVESRVDKRPTHF
ncbi:hypothetical protein DFA_11595 [Cavenderia fasciculata]|uniref:Protein-lysine N-methyltransferase DFA_11595 n=1 Tax=Cavenderia fasciculata TaxID=261658 RepID=F4QDN7_CACFS|nr:uncharacterized protein DFA_11595 [Cavenderia fasciculata]EGG13834.1 hypothetical protein DFA_11595 [Cavenderia fasciculata]|eukprot:XP_004350542.1 hypothetical protein DFA_11595 [Cavenderia fasciculata]